MNLNVTGALAAIESAMTHVRAARSEGELAPEVARLALASLADADNILARYEEKP